MKTLKERVTFEEVISRYENENRDSRSFTWARGRLENANEATGSSWTLVLLAREEILKVMLPEHRHPSDLTIIPKPGLSVAAAAKTIKGVTQETGECWENIRSHKGRDFSQGRIFLELHGDVFTHIDGLHRLLAWVTFEKKEEIAAYIVSENSGAPSS